MRKNLLILLFAGFYTSIIAQERIITAGSAITETVCALGDCDKIIASDKTSLYPDNIQQLPSIGYRSSISAEGIISLKPTLIIAEKNYVEDAVLKQLSSTGIRLVVIDRKLTPSDTRKLIEQIGQALNRKQEAQKLINAIDAELAEVTALLKKVKSKPTVLCVFNRGTTSISSAGTDTFADILPYAGGVNAIANSEGYKPLNTEALIAANPDYLLLASTGIQSIGGIEGVLKIPGVAQTTAGKKKQILSIDTLMLTNFGPRIGKAIKEITLLLHPELQGK
jgi:iron complex transport system substrate-binding protein